MLIPVSVYDRCAKKETSKTPRLTPHDRQKKRKKKMGEGRALALLRFMSQSRAVHLTARSQPRTNGQ
jgi:hypothetical protein